MWLKIQPTYHLPVHPALGPAPNAKSRKALAAWLGKGVAGGPPGMARGPRNRRILHSGSKAQDQVDFRSIVCRILVFL